MNPLYNLLNGQNKQQNNIFNLMQQFKQFKNNFQGDPKQKVQELLNSGQMTQEQFNQIYSLASQFQSMLK